MRLRSFCAVAAGALLSAAPAQAVSEQVLLGSAHFGAQLTVAPDGTASVVDPFLGAQSWRTGHEFHLRRADAGAAFGPATTLVRAHRTDRPRCAGVASDGSGIVVLDRVHAPHGRVRVRSFDPTGVVGPPRLLSTGARTARHAECAVADSGAAIVTWFQHDGGGRWHLEGALRDPGEAGFGPSRVLSGSLRRDRTSLEVAIGDRGDAMVAWYDHDATNRVPTLAVRAGGRAFGPARELAAPLSGGRMVLTVGAGGHATVAYATETRERPLRLRLAVFRLAPDEAEPSAPQLLGDTQFRFLSATVATAVTPGGRVLTAWGQSDGSLAVFEAPPAEPLHAVTTLGTEIPESDFAVAADDDGRALVAWSERDRPVASLRTGPSAAFGTPTALGARHEFAEPYAARLLPQGGALVVWGALDDDADFRASVVTRIP